MIETNNKQIERAVLIGLITGDTTKELASEHLDELELLADTAGAETVFKITQEKARIDPTYFIGKGKAEEINQLVELNDVNLIIFDDDLNPTQVRNLERLFDKKILDRSGLILDIFASHAKTNEAKTQVELAQLQYMLPRLTRAWTHLSKQYGGIGTKGPGETQIETDRRLIRTRISKLKRKLKKIESQNVTKSLQRKKFVNASLVGYTNAGKSTLLNLITNAEVLAEDKLFATLDSTTRSYDISKNQKIMISDTVGFIRKLPHNLVASFKSTLNVVRDADFILHVIDISHPFFEDHINVVEETLKEMGCGKKQQIKIFNKVDALENKETIDYVSNKYENSIIISAQRGINISSLKNLFAQFYKSSFVEHSIKINVKDSKLISTVHSLVNIIDTKYDDEDVHLSYFASNSAHRKIQSLLKRS
ncbi:MAG: GTPase HflX [Ignavibacteria bacterium]|jgi:GTP-binding protein HflX